VLITARDTCKNPAVVVFKVVLVVTTSEELVWVGIFAALSKNFQNLDALTDTLRARSPVPNNLVLSEF